MILPLFPLNFPINCFCFRIRSSSGGSRNKSAAKEDRMLDCLLRGRPTVIRVCVTPSSVAVIYCFTFSSGRSFPYQMASSGAAMDLLHRCHRFRTGRWMTLGFHFHSIISASISFSPFLFFWLFHGRSQVARLIERCTLHGRSILLPQIR